MSSQTAYAYRRLREAVQRLVEGTGTEMVVDAGGRAFSIRRHDRHARVQLGIQGGMIISLHARVQRTIGEQGPSDTNQVGPWADALARSLVAFVAAPEDGLC